MNVDVLGQTGEVLQDLLKDSKDAISGLDLAGSSANGIVVKNGEGRVASAENMPKVDEKFNVRMEREKKQSIMIDRYTIV